MEKHTDFIKNEYISGTVKKNDLFYEISFLILKKFEPQFVYRAYFLEKHSTNLINIGVIETNDEKGFLKVKCDFGKDTVVIMQKNTHTDELKFITCAFFEDEWNVKGYLDGSDLHIKINNILNNLNYSLQKYNKNADNFFMITDFKPLADLSSIKCVLFERSVNYAFFEHGYYLLKIDKNIITIGIKPINNENPFSHLNDFSYYKNGAYYIKIALEDDGQYFINLH